MHVFALIILILIPIGGWCVRTQGAMLGWFADGLKTNMGGFSYVDFFQLNCSIPIAVVALPVIWMVYGHDLYLIF